MSAPWRGTFVAEQLGVSIHSDPSGAVDVAALVGLALRRNPKRAHLLVSTVLAKHVPTEPALVMAAGGLLGAFVARELLMPDAGPHQRHAGPPSAEPPSAVPAASLHQAAGTLATVLQAQPGRRRQCIATLGHQVAALRTEVPHAVVIGYAETATGLGRLVANQLGAYYIHSTRQATPGLAPAAGFEEGHSHATSHQLVPTDPHWLDGAGPVVLVDDEFSTGSTVINTIRELHALVAHDAYVVAALIDLRSSADRARFEALEEELGCRISVKALGTGSVDLGDGILDRAAALIESLPQKEAHPRKAAGSPAPPAGRLSMLELTAADVTPVRSDRFGNTAPPSTATITAVAGQVAAHLAAHACRGPIAVVGCEENMFLPLAVAHALQGLRPEDDVRFSTTTRSPIVPVDRDDYAIAGALAFASHDLTNDGPGVRFAYNLNGSGQRPGTVVMFPEPGTDRHDVVRSAVPQLAPLGMARAMTTAADDAVVVLLPADSPLPTTPKPKQTEDTP